jgi:hypothetical protein
MRILALRRVRRRSLALWAVDRRSGAGVAPQKIGGVSFRRATSIAWRAARSQARLTQLAAASGGVSACMADGELEVERRGDAADGRQGFFAGPFGEAWPGSRSCQSAVIRAPTLLTAQSPKHGFEDCYAIGLDHHLVTSMDEAILGGLEQCVGDRE